MTNVATSDFFIFNVLTLSAFGFFDTDTVVVCVYYLFDFGYFACSLPFPCMYLCVTVSALCSYYSLVIDCLHLCTDKVDSHLKA